MGKRGPKPGTGGRPVGATLAPVVVERIERNRERFEGHTFPCPICERDDLPIIVDKNGKPYCCCAECGMQMFVRAEQGCDQLEQQLIARSGNPAPSLDQPAARGAESVFNRDVRTRKVS